MTVLVTGGSGVVGASLIRHLIERGMAVSALSRTSASDVILRNVGAAPVRGDVTDPATLRSAVAGVELVYHVAGVNTMCPVDPSELYRVNVDGSRNVVAAAEDAGVRRIVYTSSAAAIGEPAGTVGTESTPHRGSYLSHYERSKHLAEEAVFAAADHVEVVAVNPSSVQGPGRATGTGALILDLLRDRLPALVDSRLSIVDIDDCSRGHILAAEKGVPGERYVLNSFTMTMRDAVGILDRVVEGSLSVRWVPGWVASIGVLGVEGLARLRKRKPAFCREMVRTLRHGHAYDGSKATRELGLEYSTAPDLLGRLVAWFRAEGML
ncbi:MAG: NAD-dependent epimerase/dehydratase family protein [Acidimicrobiia bacterium]